MAAVSMSRLQAALNPLGRPPVAAPWNLEELSGLLADAQPLRAAVLVGLVDRPGGLQVLLTRRTGALRHHAGQVSFPGGRIEPGDVDARAAAIRETVEEVGIHAAQLQPLGYLDRIATITGFVVTPLVALVSPEYRALPDADEVDEVFEVPFDYLMSPANLRRIDVEVGGRRRVVLEYIGDGDPARRIWGVSASILYNFQQRLGASR